MMNLFGVGFFFGFDLVMFFYMGFLGMFGFLFGMGMLFMLFGFMFGEFREKLKKRKCEVVENIENIFL